MDRVMQCIRDVPDFPIKGIIFKDITPILLDPEAFNQVLDEFEKRCEGLQIDAIAGMESRGFLFGAPMALRMKLPFILIRKEGKLPADTIKVSYDLEYGSATFEIHKDAIKPGHRVLVIDDLLATGGTAEATIRLVEALGGKVVRLAFVIELGFLNGRAKLPEGIVDSLIIYD